MRKSELKDGMVVKVTGYDTKKYNGLMLYLGGDLFDINEWDKLENFHMNDEEYNEGLKIVAVYEFISRYDDEISSLKDILKESNVNKLKLLWRDEREIDWRKVPKFTPVLGGYFEGELKNAYFLAFDSMENDFPFLLTNMKDDEFTGLKHRHQNEFVCDICKIHPSVEIKEEWYK
ncbi:hypothetical protein [Clostridium phage vB_CpeP_PMQ04]|nr:hypothetical protein [Clostridium phage vB_CpeP_PMQ04]